MSDKPKELPKLPPLTKEAIEKALKDFKPFDENPAVKKTPYYHCEYCQDTGWVDVYGGPNRPCGHCGPKY